MREFSQFHIGDPLDFTGRLTGWAQDFQVACLLHSNGYRKKLTGPWMRHTYDLIAGVGVIGSYGLNQSGLNGSLDGFIEASSDWLFGHLSYDLKNRIERLVSGHPDHIDFPLLHFFIPRYVFILNGNTLEVGRHPEYDNDRAIPGILGEILDRPLPLMEKAFPGEIRSVMSKQDYLEAVTGIKDHIQKGNIYETNFCQEFFSTGADIDPAGTWLQLIAESPTPFSCFYRLNEKFLLCASPERFLKKTGNKIISQPIKGTWPRGSTPESDRAAMRQLAADRKERAENIMITDLVRNDLSRIATRGSVRVNELCGVYPFPRLLQMQSDISASLRPGISFTGIIKSTFPMGSMTGAPKIRSMEIIEQFEKTRRGLYSGSVGYISPRKDFDLNVVIRSLQYNRAASFLSFMVGGAITAGSTPENEYLECMLKAGAIMKVLQQC
jgi:para-aminobenzoate synthetase component I